MLKIQFKDRRQNPIWIIEKRYTIGSAEDNHLVVEQLDAHHARLLTKNNQLFLKDNNSREGCYVNDQRITEKQLLPGDTIRLGTLELEILDPRESLTQAVLEDNAIPQRWSLVADSSWLSGQEFEIPPRSAIIGRGSQCDIIIPGTHMSRQHAQLTVKGNMLHVRDLASSNGTYINEERVEEGIARPGDRLRLDVYSFRLIGPEKDANKTQIRRAVAAPTVARKTVSDEPKQWITKPTSPGNRIEPETPRGSQWMLALSLALCVAIVGVLAYVFI
ncbi:FHA domain-containing protein [Pseudomaricurvus alkylphenolicus]|jgi:pSer/pThr/pTyr-binding forkhead associated (FHA) protein|uniref:FHA domain-containing protein n=1 Tax=Pseudomaricurvus alkylphenolicus TaxID=1306991 RepID=UPI00141DF9C7|nr:FHA domain-containing protein [Pseudomaricurvus alkylphenolicus]NIB41806.1 FHA domain-containing protein [Pseudomaricurvus alkylphenolicus]